VIFSWLDTSSAHDLLQENAVFLIMALFLEYDLVGKP
jgi:hypothetical protein